MTLTELRGPITVFIIIAVVFVVYVLFAIIRSQRKKISTGREDLIGKIAITYTDLNPTGTVMLDGELWKATSESGYTSAGTQVTVNRLSGLMLYVTNK